MGQPVGSIFQIGIESEANDQRCLNILHYKVTVESTTASIVDETVELANALNGINSVIPKMRDCMSDQTQVKRVSAQCIRGTRFAIQKVILNLAGTISAACNAQNLSAVITKRTAFSGRWAVGAFHVPGLPTSAYLGGNLEQVTYKPLVETLGAELLDPITTAGGGGTYVPVLLHPPGSHGGSTDLLQTEVQDQVRVMRRRTVGLGI